jgi:hypothetical protein
MKLNNETLYYRVRYSPKLPKLPEVGIFSSALYIEALVIDLIQSGREIMFCTQNQRETRQLKFRNVSENVN